MILAAPLVIPFAKAVGLSVGTLGMAALADQVNDYIQANPEESMKILSTIIPNVGIGQIFMSKEDKISLEDLDEMTDEEAQDLSKEEKAELMKQAGKRRNRELSISTAEKIGLTYPDREKQDIEYDVDKRYDEGGVEQKKAPFDYTKFFRKRKADGGAIGIEVLFEEKKPRKNFNLGGLTGPAKNIYDTMMAAGYFTEDEIRNAIINAGYEIPGATTTTTPVTNVAPNIINQGGGEDRPTPPGPKTFDKGFSSLNFGLGRDVVNKDAVVDYEAEAYNVGPTFRGSIARVLSNLKSIPTPFNLARMGIEKAIEFTKQKQKEKEAQLAAITRDIARDNKAAGTGGYQSSFGQDTGFMEGKGTAAEMGSFKDGGLVSMFVEKK
jgi:hypothetical protein